ncbi:hypothetical protein [Runella sp.]|uniref:hypothetical protein n=1 Tax=Runella sp. TaxID=1960881 RepID=UPI003D0C4323
MLAEIINKYENFSDALISEIIYRVFENSKSVELVVSCMNSLNDYKFETIKLTFMDIVSIRFNENANQSSTLINSALLVNDDGIIIADFFPLIYAGGNLKENENSDFKIKCRKLSYAKI